MLQKFFINGAMFSYDMRPGHVLPESLIQAPGNGYVLVVDIGNEMQISFYSIEGVEYGESSLEIVWMKNDLQSITKDMVMSLRIGLYCEDHPAERVKKEMQRKVQRSRMMKRAAAVVNERIMNDETQYRPKSLKPTHGTRSAIKKHSVMKHGGYFFRRGARELLDAKVVSAQVVRDDATEAEKAAAKEAEKKNNDMFKKGYIGKDYNPKNLPLPV